MRRAPISRSGSVARPAALHNAHNVGAGPPRRQAPQHPGGSNDYAYLIDFGIARAATDTRLTSASSAIGTWAYMAPERFNSAEVHPSSDIYALACVLYQCLTGQQPFPGSTLEQVAVGHMVTPPPRPSERAAIQPALDEVVATGLAKQPADRYSTSVEMASAAKEAVTGATPSGAVPTPQPPPPDVIPGALHWGEQPWTQVGNTPAPYPASAPTQFSGPHRAQQRPTPPPSPKRAGRHRGVLVGALVFVATLVVVGGVVAVIQFTRHDDPPSTTSSPAATAGVDFSGTYRADYGPGTDLDDKPVQNAPATTNNWDVRSECGAAGCVATAASASGNALLSNMTFDRLGGTWVAVGLVSAQCGTPDPVEIWVILTLQPRPDEQGCRCRRDPAAGAQSGRGVARRLPRDDELHRRHRPSGQGSRRRNLLPTHRRSVHEPVPRGR